MQLNDEGQVIENKYDDKEQLLIPNKSDNKGNCFYLDIFSDKRKVQNNFFHFSDCAFLLLIICVIIATIKAIEILLNCGQHTNYVQHFKIESVFHTSNNSIVDSLNEK